MLSEDEVRGMIATPLHLPGRTRHTRRGGPENAFAYGVDYLLIDPERDALGGLASRNRFNLVSLSDRDHGDGGDIRAWLDGIAAKSGLDTAVKRFMMLCYPRVLGYGFNPLTVYYGLDAEDRVCLTIYEVNNTFGERQTYVLPAVQEGDAPISQSCAKRLYVSPFNGPKGTYSFHLTAPLEQLTVGVALRDADGPVLKAHFHGRREPLTDAGLLRALAGTGWMTVKVMAGIHWEALKLWLKGLRLQPRPAAPARAIDFGEQLSAQDR